MSEHEEHSLVCMEVWGGNQATSSSVKLAGLDAWVYSKPYEQADGGGDVYYVSSCATGRITRLLVADVSGHGNAVADVAVVLRQLMRQHVNQLDQRQFVKRMNAQFVEQSKLGQFATALVTTYFSTTNSLSLCNAGHPPPLYYSARDRQWRFLEESDSNQSPELSNVPLGIIDLADYEQFDVALDVNDLILCYTDSLPEARRTDGTMLQMQGLLEIINSVEIGQIQTFIPRVIEAIERSLGTIITGDDITLLLFKPNIVTADRGFISRMKAPFRIAKAMYQAIKNRDGSFPLPDFSLPNLGGWLIPALGRMRRKV